MKSFGIMKPNGNLATLTKFFTNRPEAASEAVRSALSSGKMNEVRFSSVDGSNLTWKQLKRQGWKIVPVEHVVAK